MLHSIMHGVVRSFRRLNSLIILNIIGLAIGLISVMFISLWIQHELSYDQFFKNADRIYRVESLMNFAGEPVAWPIAPSPLAESIKEEFSEVENSVKLKSGFQASVQVGEEVYNAENLYYSSDSYFKIFSTKVIAGDPSKLLLDPSEIIISKNIAEMLFGKEYPIGKTILLNNTDLLTVKGIIENSPSNTHLKIDYLVSFSLLEKGGKKLNSWKQFDYITYVLLKPKVDANQFNSKITDYLKTKNNETKAKIFINPLTRLYLYRNPEFESIKYPTYEEEPISRVRLFAIIGVIILIIACINFVNLSTAFATRRAKEIGVRKVNGAGKANLIIQLLGESLLQTSIASIIALIVVVVLLPTFIKISGVSIVPDLLFSPFYLIFYLTLIIITGLLAGIYPALVLSSFNPIKAIKPVPEGVTQGSGLRRILVVFQFGLSIIFIFCIIVMNRQISFMQKKDLGFNGENVVVVSPRAKVDVVNIIADQIGKIPGVKEVAFANVIPVNMGNFCILSNWDGNLADKSLKFHMMQVDDNLLNFLGIKMIEGRQFDNGTVKNEVIINEAAVRKMGIQDPLGKTISWSDEKYTIIGVVKDFHYRKLSEEILPVFIYKNNEWWSKKIYVKLESREFIKIIDRILDVASNRTPGFPVKSIFLNDEINRYYSDERDLSTLINVATFLSIIISSIGLFSLTTFTFGRRRKEIGIRKVYGANVPNLVMKLQLDFFKLILISSIISFPIGYFFANRWLQSYAYHITPSILYFFITFLILTLISFCILLYHTFKAANQNPVETLRNE